MLKADKFSMSIGLIVSLIMYAPIVAVISVLAWTQFLSPEVREADQKKQKQVEEHSQQEVASAHRVSRWNWNKFSCCNAPRPKARAGASSEIGSIALARPVIEVQRDLALAIEASAVTRQVGVTRDCFSGYGIWTLVEVTSRIVTLAVELHAASNGLSHKNHERILRDVRNRLSGDGMRIFFARTWGDCWSNPPLIVLENQRGQRGRLIEATPSLRSEGTIFMGSTYGVLMFEDRVGRSDATYTIDFLLNSGIQHFTFDATEGRVMLTLGSSIHPPEQTFSPIYDSNSDGFSVGDAIGLFGNIMDVISLLAL